MRVATLHVRNVPEPLYDALRVCAEQEGRSIGAQTVVLLEGALVTGVRPRGWRGGRRRQGRRGMFQRFTGPAREAVRLAQDEARDLGHDYIGTEHLLLGLLREEGGVAANALEQLNLDQARLRARIDEIVGRGTGTPPGYVRFTPRAKKILELALREALSLRHDYIGTEHILLAILRDGEGVAAESLHEQGIDEQKVRGVVIAMLARPPFESEAPASEAPDYMAVTLEGPAERWTESLNELAEQGWELFSITPVGNETRAVLRRA